MKIRQVVIPAAGMGTRFLPITKVVPKELLPILEKPAIHHIVKEALDSSIDQVCLVVSDEKQAIRNYFSPTQGALNTLATRNPALLERLSSVNDLIGQATYHYVTQHEQLGLGHAILQAREVIDGNYFAVLLPDELIMHTVPALEQLQHIARLHNVSVLGVKRVAPDAISAYGVVAIKKQISERLWQVADAVEKPAAHDAPSDLAIIGRYLLSPAIFDLLAVAKAGYKGEIQLTDALAALLKAGHPVFAYEIEGDRFDIGTPVGWLAANNYAAQRG